MNPRARGKIASMQNDSENDPIVYVVDDDENVGETTRMLLDSVGLSSRIFSSATDFIEGYVPDELSCLVLDIRMPGMSGLELQERLTDAGIELPIIFITGYGDVEIAVTALRNGAFDFIEKPCRDQRLLDSINAAIRESEDKQAEARKRRTLLRRWRTLTKREKQVAELVITGRPNKVLAYELGVSQRTVEIHRSRIMRKMAANSLADLVRMHLEIGNAAEDTTTAS